VSSSAYTGFNSPNFPPLGEVGERIKIDTKVVRKPSKEGFFINEVLEKNVLMFDIYPGIKPEILDKVFSIEGLKGVVLRTFGAGNGPTDEEFLAAIGRAVKKGLAVVNITQCLEGMVEMGLYDTSAGLLKLGVISGVDMTPESALVKMQFLLGMRYDIEMVKRLMQKDLRGEQSVNVFNLIYAGGEANMVYRAPAQQMEAGFRKDKIVKAHMRIDDAVLPEDVKEGTVELAAFMNYPSVDETTDTSIPQCLGVLKSNYNGEPVNLILDCTEKVSQVLNPDRPVQIALVSKTGHPVTWEGAFLSLYTSAGE
jgi:L-asparaginase